MEILIALLFIALIITNIWFYWSSRPFNVVIAGTTKYMPGCPHPLRHDAKIKNAKRHNIMFARAAEDGELWSKGDVLIVNKWFNVFAKNQFYLSEGAKNEYRIAKCIGSSPGFPEIFDGSETFITHDILGVVIGRWRMATNEHEYFEVKS